MTIPNTTCTIVFTRCVFNNQAIGISAPFGYVTFRDCTNMNSLSLPAVYSGENALVNRTSSLVATTVTATSISLGGLSTQYLMGNGSLLTATYPTITSITGNATYNANNNIGYKARRVGITGAGVCTVYIGAWSVLAVTTTSTLITSSFLPATYRPLNAVFVPCRITKLGVIQMGTLVIGITDVAQTANFWSSGNTACGIPADTTVSFCTL